MGNMSYEEFCSYMQEKIQQYYGVEADVRLHNVKKVNGVLLRGISVVMENRNIMPTLYLEHFYDEYESGRPLYQIISSFIDNYEKACIYEDFDIGFFEDYEQVKPHLGYKLINYEMNRALLEEIPYKRYLDLAIVCFCNIVDDRIGNGTILIRNEHLDIWNVKAEEMIADSMKNMQKMFPPELLNMSQVLKELYDDPAGLIAAKLPMYVLTVRERVFGAAGLLYDGQLESIAETVEDDFYLLPSSIHEVIIFPKKIGTDENYLSQMVDEINHEQLDREEILSNHAYLYTRLTKEITSLPLVPYKKN